MPLKFRGRNESMTARRVLIIDDELIVCMSCKRALEKKGYEVDSAQNGAEGLEMARRADYDIIFTDLKMPNMEGTEVALNLRSIAPRAKIVVMTGFCTEENYIAITSMGVAGYMEKPFAPSDIVQMVERLERGESGVAEL